MIRIIKYFLLGSLVFLVAPACKKDYLEVIPVGNQVATETKDYDLLMNDVLLYFVQTGGWQDAVVMGDEISAVESYFSQMGAQAPRLFKWQPDIYPTTGTSPIEEQSPKLYTINKVINEVMQSKNGVETDKKRIHAEGLAARAMLNFNFINYYGKPYNPATASTDPGYPIITQADVSQTTFDRGTVQAMYEFMIGDLKNAIPDLPAKSSYPTRWSSAAAKAFLAKVYVFMGKYTDALPLLNESLASIAATGSPSLYNYNVELAPGGSFLPIDPTYGPSGPGNNKFDYHESALGLGFYNGVYQYFGFGNNGIVITTATRDLYGANDLRRRLYTTTTTKGTPNPDGTLRKYAVKFSKQGLELAEIILLRAECKARTNDLAGAVTDLQWLRQNRMPVADATVPPATAADAQALIKFIIDERTREFAAEGMRWFDMRRLSTDPLFSSLAYQHTYYKNNNTTEVFTLDKPNRLVMRIPTRALQDNPNFTNNP